MTLQGVRGLWKGVTASYWGISETMMHWMVYEYLKKQLAEYKARNSNGAGGGKGGGGLTGVDMVGLMGCGACSRLCATAVAYPHGACGMLSKHMSSENPTLERERAARFIRGTTFCGTKN